MASTKPFQAYQSPAARRGKYLARVLRYSYSLQFRSNSMGGTLREPPFPRASATACKIKSSVPTMTPSKQRLFPPFALSAILAPRIRWLPQSPPLPDSPRARFGIACSASASASDTSPLQPSLRPSFQRALTPVIPAARKASSG